MTKKYVHLKDRGKILKEEVERSGFVCLHCQEWVDFSKSMVTKNRNHCPFCLWSKHVDLEKSGDRDSDCEGLMSPLGLTFKHEGFDKWGKKKKGELMLVHKCVKCKEVSINRIAGDDDADEIMDIYRKSLDIGEEEIKELEKENINLLGKEDEKEIKGQLFGNKL